MRADWMVGLVALVGLVLLGTGLGLAVGPGTGLSVVGAILVGWAFAADLIAARR